LELEGQIEEQKEEQKEEEKEEVLELEMIGRLPSRLSSVNEDVLE
jgi:hypothetical protein